MGTPHKAWPGLSLESWVFLRPMLTDLLVPTLTYREPGPEQRMGWSLRYNSYGMTFRVTVSAWLNFIFLVSSGIKIMSIVDWREQR